MDVQLSTWWWVATALVIAAELATGTFYLLMIALGTTAAALAAHAGMAVNLQLLIAAGLGYGATALWHWRRSRRASASPAQANPDVHLDIGERVHVAAWLSDRTARVTYRGTSWNARLTDGASAAGGPHTVQSVEGNRLVLAPLSS